MIRNLFLAIAICSNVAYAAPPAQNPYVPSPLETRVIGPSTFLSGSQASLRVLTIDHALRKPVDKARVRIELRKTGAGGADQKPQVLFSGVTNRRGTVDASFKLPHLAAGPYALHVTAAATGLGEDAITQSVSLIEKAQLLVTTDKPLYQPAQVMHLRVLALGRPDNKPVGGQAMTVEVEDPKGNKVFKETKDSSAYGVVGVDFRLGNEISLGRYTVRAILGDNREERKVTVERYVLPKFKVIASTEKTFYTPGAVLVGKVQADYFFGKPVSGAQVTARLSTFDVGVQNLAELQGKTDSSGTWSFETQLPQQFVGQPVNQGQATVAIEVTVKDRAEHEEKATITVPVSKDSIRITVVPESGKVIPHVENRFFVLTSYPDGTPVASRITWKGVGYEYSGSTDALGVAEVPLTPRGTIAQAGSGPAVPVAGDVVGPVGGGFAGPVGRRGRLGRPMPMPGGEAETPMEQLRFTIVARDPKGNTGSSEQSFDYKQQDETILLRASRSVARVGEELGLSIIASRSTGTAYLDVIRDAQTLLTKSVDFENGKGVARIALDNSLAGTLYVSAYMITTKGEIVRDQRVVYVNAANDLNIKIQPDKETYLPGAPAKIKVVVTDRANRPIAAALGVNIVDESVFALQEMQPGMEKIYFTLERELMKPRVEVHEFSMNEVLSAEWTRRNAAGVAAREETHRQQAARILFAAAAAVDSAPAINVNTYQAKYEAVLNKWYEAMEKDGKAIWTAAQKYSQKTNKWVTPAEVTTILGVEKLIPEDQLQDPLGMPYRIELQQGGVKDLRGGFLLTAAGPDKEFNTSDDVTIFVYQGGGVFRGRDMNFAMDGIAVRRFGARAGGMGGGGIPMMMAPAGAVVEERLALAVEKSGDRAEGGADEPGVRVRQFFPETLLSLPNVITDERGQAMIDVDMADSITTWRLSALASGRAGELGSTTSPLRVFQDFFVDLDLPVSLTQNDEVSVPVAIYNYLPESQRIRLTLDRGDWFESRGELVREVTLDKGEVNVVYYPLKVTGIGNHTLTVTARGSKMSDAIKRAIEVRPDGKELWETVNDRLEPGTVERTVTLPAQAIEDASNLLVRIYPGGFSEVVDGLDKILRMPFG